MTKIIAMISYYEEDPDLLRECIRRLRAVGINKLVCVDGPYDLYPSKNRISSLACQRAIMDAAIGGVRSLDLIMRSRSGWEGNEVEKRNYMLQEALKVAEEGDWLLVADVDHMWEKRLGDADLGRLLSMIVGFNVAEVAFAECALEDPNPSWYEARLLLRAVPGATYEGAHWRVRFPDGTAVSTLKGGDQYIDEPAEIVPLNSFFAVRHLKYTLPEDRGERQRVYYEGRDAGEGIER
jgi:hypothetical protein